MKKYYQSILLLIIILSGCKKTISPDAYGFFEAREILVSSETNGKIIKLYHEEGDFVYKNDTIAIIDTTTLVLQKKLLLNQKKIIISKFKSLTAQIDVQSEQKKILEKEKNRFEKLLKDSAISQKQYDDLCGQLQIVEKNINALESNKSQIAGELSTLDAQIDIIQRQISSCFVLAPINGTIVEKYFNEGEFCTLGKYIVKMADLSTLELITYVTQDLLSSLKLGQKATVLVDTSINMYKKYTGKIVWISSKNEFTPKNIPTRKERANLVYAVKLLVKNDGYIRSGMPAEVIFSKEKQ